MRTCFPAIINAKFASHPKRLLNYAWWAQIEDPRVEVEAQPSDGLVLRGIILCSLEVVILQTDTQVNMHRVSAFGVFDHLFKISSWGAKKGILHSF